MVACALQGYRLGSYTVLQSTVMKMLAAMTSAFNAIVAKQGTKADDIVVKQAGRGAKALHDDCVVGKHIF
jgi:hypothetical protein